MICCMACSCWLSREHEEVNIPDWWERVWDTGVGNDACLEQRGSGLLWALSLYLLGQRLLLAWCEGIHPLPANGNGQRCNTLHARLHAADTVILCPWACLGKGGGGLVL